MGRIASAAGWAGATGAAWAVGQGIEANAFMKAAHRMNAQVEADWECAGRGFLPDTQPLFPLQGPLVASKPKIMAKCFGAGAGVMFAVGFVIAFGVILASQPQGPSPLVQAVFGGILTGVFAAVMVGWLVAAILWLVFGTKENARRSANVVTQHYRAYWAERVRAQHALTQGVDREQVQQALWGYRIMTEPDEMLFGSGEVA